jgi:PhnB protein
MRITAVTPYLAIKGAAAAIDWYRDVFGAEEVLRWHDPDGRISHAEIRIGGVPIFLADEHPELEQIVGPLTLGGSPILLDLDVDDVDELFERAVAAGATPVRPPDHPTSGVQAAKITDPFGHVWLFSKLVG